MSCTDPATSQGHVSSGTTKAEAREEQEGQEKQTPPQETSDQDQESQIVQFYNNKSVLLTGASGFVGKFIIEKLLRACPDLRTIYIIIRPKKNKSAQERGQQLLESVIFDGVRPQLAQNKVQVLEGDITQPLLGLNEADLKQVAANVSVVIHSAAVVGFEQPLKWALESNLVGAYNVIQVAKRLKRLHSLVAVSTAYANCIRRQLDEHVYPVNVEPTAMVDLAISLDQDILESMKRCLLGDHPNTYTYTKSLSEWLCYEHASSTTDWMPIVLCRPSVVTAAWKEPIPGLVDNINAANGIYYNIMCGYLRSAHGQPLYNLDQIPVDVVTNCILASGWFGHLYHGRRRAALKPVGAKLDANEAAVDKFADKLDEFRANVEALAESKGLPKSIADLPVFHITSGAERSISMGTFMDYITDYSREFPSAHLARCPSFELSPWPLKVRIQRLISHVFVPHCIDLLSLLGRSSHERRLTWRQSCRKSDHLMDVVRYFLSRSWEFNPENRQRLTADFMSIQDKRQFNCDITTIDWNDYCRQYARGLRRFVLREPDTSLPEARSRLRSVYLRNSILQLGLAACGCYLTALMLWGNSVF